MTSHLNTFTTEYFATRPSSQWDFPSYLAAINELHPGLKLGEVNSRFYTALKKIAASSSSPILAVAKAQLLMNQVQQRSNKRKMNREQHRIREQRRDREQQGFVNHGKVSITHGGGTIIEDQRVGKGQHITGSTAGGNLSIENTEKRRRLEPVPRRTPTPTLPEFSEEDEDDQYEEEEEEEEEEGWGGGEESSIPSGKHHGLNTSDSDRFDSFLNSFSAMRGADKRTFTCSGRVLEDVIHAGVTANPSTAGDTLNWVIDLGADNIRGWFSSPELKELCSWLPPTPKADEYFTYARSRYDEKSSIIDLRETSESKPTPPGTTYNRKLTFNATYVNAAITSLLSTIEQSATNESFGSPQSHREGWYGSKIWSMLLDHCLDDLDNFTVSRTDIASKVGCPGRRFDAMFLAGGVGVNLAEVGAVEVARSGDVLGVGKRHGDQSKLRELMKAMVKALWNMSKCKDEAGRKLQVVGVQHVGFNIRISTMCAVSRGVFVLQPGKWRAVPHKLENFGAVFDVLQAVVVMKAVVRRTVEELRAHANVKAEADDDFEL